MSRRKRRIALALAVGLLWLYPVSLGPLVWLHDRRHVPIPNGLMTIYVPIYLACQRSKLCNETIGRYVRYWESLP